MIARNAKLAALLLSAAFISCSQNDELLPGDASDGSEVTTTVTVSMPDMLASRSNVPAGVYDAQANYLGESGYPSIGNVDLNDKPVTFTVGVYVKKTENDATEPTYTLVEKQGKTVTASEVSFNFQLLKGRKYHIVAYADFESAQKEDLSNITFSTPLKDVLNDELKDAFFASQEFVASPNMDVVLKRPFGKLRLIANDFNTFAAGQMYKITGVKVAYHKPYMLNSTVFNAITGEFDDESQSESDIETAEVKPVTYELEYGEDGKAARAAVFTMYLPANWGVEDERPYDGPPVLDVPEGTKVPQSWMYPFTVTVTYQDSKGTEYQHTREYNIDIPVKRNWLTTVEDSHFWTDNSEIKVTIDHRFDNFINIGSEAQTVKTAEELQAAINRITAGNGVGSIILGEDIDASEIGGFYISRKGGAVIDLDFNGKVILVDGTRNAKPVDGDGYAFDGVLGLRNNFCRLILHDSSPEATGGIEFNRAEGADPQYSYPLIQCTRGSSAIINGGTYKHSEFQEVVYAYDDNTWILAVKDMADVDTRRSTIVINGGRFENGKKNQYYRTEYGKVLRNPVVNAYNPTKDWWNKNYSNAVYGTLSRIYIRGGSYVAYNPALGDNICGNDCNEWVNPNKYTVLYEIVNSDTVFTVVPKDSQRLY